MNRYVVFYTKGNKELARFLTDRSHELGYDGTSKRPEESVTLDRKNGIINWTDYKYPLLYEDHELGDFEKFLTTDFYKFERKPEIYIGGYKVKFEKDGIRVGCEYIGKETILAIAKEFQEL